ncbi:hypothetical protein [Bradyrhizobium sp. SZCCHNRI2049]|uniref:hypothetical protein n=1 Tax=Bradyrhizobium sp. SZCCHNRI2049 TaxID=3057287 RepID=UPI002916862E|nr:hypothetical protein [Bradyrhizobium sp. SZCCHNRI2049]
MQLIDQGLWTQYTPDPFPPNLPFNTAFARRQTDSLDWYDALYGQAPLFQADSLKCTVWQLPDSTWMVQAVDVDATKIFPCGCRCIEVVGYTGTDAFADIHGLQYKPETNTLAPFPPKPVSVTARQIRAALSQKGWRTAFENYVKAADYDVQDWWTYSTTFLDSDPIMASAMSALGHSADDVRSLFTLARTL